MCNSSEILQYKKLLKLKKYFILNIYIVTPVIIFLVYSLFSYWGHEGFAFLIGLIFTLLLMLLNVLFFLANSNCPWCHHNFFIKDYSDFGLGFFFRVKCKNCKKPF